MSHNLKRRKVVVGIFAIVGALLAGGLTYGLTRGINSIFAQPNGASTLYVNVQDSSTHKGIAGLQLLARKGVLGEWIRSVQVGPYGVYRFNNLTPGDYRVSFEGSGALFGYQKCKTVDEFGSCVIATVKPNEESSAQIMLDPLPKTKPCEGKTITECINRGNGIVEVKCPSTQIYSPYCEQSKSADIIGKGYIMWWKCTGTQPVAYLNQTCDSGCTTDSPPKCNPPQPGTQIKLGSNVKSGGGVPLANLTGTLVVIAGGKTLSLPVTTSSDGSLPLITLSAGMTGSGTASFTPTGNPGGNYNPASVTTSFTAGKTTQLTFTLSCRKLQSINVSGYVKDNTVNRKPIGYASVSLKNTALPTGVGSSACSGETYSATTNSSGQYKIVVAGAPRGLPYSVNAYMDLFRPYTNPYVLVNTQQGTTNFYMTDILLSRQ